MTKLRRAKMKGSVVSSSGLETDSGSEYYKKRMEEQTKEEKSVVEKLADNPPKPKSENKCEHSEREANGYCPHCETGMKKEDYSSICKKRKHCKWNMQSLVPHCSTCGIRKDQKKYMRRSKK